jgi:hypothetical protein
VVDKVNEGGQRRPKQSQIDGLKADKKNRKAQMDRIMADGEGPAGADMPVEDGQRTAEGTDLRRPLASRSLRISMQVKFKHARGAC